MNTTKGHTMNRYTFNVRTMFRGIAVAVVAVVLATPAAQAVAGGGRVGYADSFKSNDDVSIVVRDNPHPVPAGGGQAHLKFDWVQPTILVEAPSPDARKFLDASLGDDIVIRGQNFPGTYSLVAAGTAGRLIKVEITLAQGGLRVKWLKAVTSR